MKKTSAPTENERTVTGMDEYITKEQVIEWFRCYTHEDIPIIFDDLEFYIQHMIPEDVATVRHGRWDSSGKYRFQKDNSVAVRCTECGCSLTELEYRRHIWNYCPVCGTKMDLEEM